MKTQTKFVNVWIVQGNYGYGWDDLCAGDTWREVREDLRDYRNNEPYPHRAIRRRIKREDYATGNY
jgi:hypothetical protein